MTTISGSRRVLPGADSMTAPAHAGKRTHDERTPRNRPAALSATPNPVPPGPELGQCAVSWDTGDGTPGLVFIKVSGHDEALFGEGSFGVKEAPWISHGATYEFTLRHRADSRVLARIEVARGLPAAIIATPNPVPVTGGGGSTEIAWDTGNDHVGYVYLKEPGKQAVLFAEGRSGSKSAPWIQRGGVYQFLLYQGDHRDRLVSFVSVQTGRKPSILATPNPVWIAPDAGTGSAMISWDTGSSTPGTVCIVGPDGNEEVFATGGRGSREASWISPGAAYELRLYHGLDREMLLGAVKLTGRPRP